MSQFVPDISVAIRYNLLTLSLISFCVNNFISSILYISNIPKTMFKFFICSHTCTVNTCIQYLYCHTCTHTCTVNTCTVNTCTVNTCTVILVSCVDSLLYSSISGNLLFPLTASYLSYLMNQMIKEVFLIRTHFTHHNWSDIFLTSFAVFVRPVREMLFMDRCWTKREKHCTQREHNRACSQPLQYIRASA